MGTKQFSAATVLTVTTGRLLTPIGNLYAILSWMAGESVWTHQLARFCAECKPWLLRWFPELEQAGDEKQLAKLDELLERAPHHNESPEQAVNRWMAETCECGLQDTYEVPQIPRDDHTHKDPYDELVEMRGTDEGIVLL